MKFRNFVPSGKILLFMIFLVTSGNLKSQPFQLQNAFPNVTFSSPLYVTHSNDGTNRVFVIQQGGLVRVMPNDSNTTDIRTYLNVTNKISSGGERGLLGLAFHPNYAANGYFYINYTRSSDGATVISRFKKSTSDPNKADSLSEYILLTIPQPFSNHNGGILFFGLDGYLYIGMGDGGSGGDPGNRAQNPQELLGKILRLNVDTTTSTTNYGIPPTNPYYGNPTAGRPEIFVMGMRNPWRISQDPVTGMIWCGDVGQGSWEEIDIIEVGKNYGWRCYEGDHPYNTAGCQSASFYTFPIKEYANAGSECSITGGFVYRGLRRAPELEGRYIYGDYCSRKIWKLKYENGTVTEDSLIVTAPSSIYSFGIDQNNELYVCCSNGIIYRFNKSDLVSAGNNNEVNVPERFILEQNYPNPFNPETNIRYHLPNSAKVRLVIYDATGREVRTLINTMQMAGDYNIAWNGKDNTGASAASGIYFYSVTAGDDVATKKMLMLK